MRKPQYLFWIGLLAVAASVGVHVYLVNHHYQYKYGHDLNTGGLCNINEAFNCNATTASNFSELFGIPVAIFGALVNLILLFVLLGYKFPVFGRSSQSSLVTPIKILALGIFGTSVVMLIISLFFIGSLCPMCSLAYLLSFISLVCLWIFLGKGLTLSSFDYKFIPVVGLVTLLFGFLIHHNQLRSLGGKEVAEMMNLQLEDWKNSPEKTLTTIEPMTINASANAKIKIVEFADYLCPHCATVYPILHDFIKKHPDIEFSFQAFPLDGACNAAIPSSEGTRCLLAGISQCAYKQGKGWEAQEWIFKNQRDLLSQDVVKQKLKEAVPTLGINEELLNTCVESEETKKAILGQAKVGADAGITGTPSVFINGKKVPSGFNIPLLEKIYQELN